MGILKALKMSFRYLRQDEDGNILEEGLALDGIDLDIKEGEFVAVLGRNGSGKSTLAKHMNALLLPTEGTMIVREMDSKDEANLWDIRQCTGMVFQNPDNQIIGTVVEEDVGFGPENIGIPTDDIWKRVDESLNAVGMAAYRAKNPTRLSGGQKQRVAIAGVMAMRPRCIVLDEPTAMLDPNGRKEVIRTVRELNKREGITVILITHYMEEAVNADRVVVVQKGKIALEGTPREVFARVDRIRECGLDVPQVTELAWELRQKGYPLPEAVLTVDEFKEAVLPLIRRKGGEKEC